MNRLTIVPSGKTIDVKDGITILKALRQAGIEISTPCNGRRLCGKCKIHLEDRDQAAPVAHEKLTAGELAEGVRLACETRIEKDLRISLPENSSQDTRILEGERIGRTRLAPAAAIEEKQSDYRLLYRNRPPVTLDGWRAGATPTGLALDLGTTTLVATLMDLSTGAELATASAVNPQHRFGHDVMTRIQKASTEEGLADLSSLIADAMNALCREACRACGAEPRDIVDAVIGGNTAMLQIAAGIDPSPLGVLPFSVGIQSGRTYAAGRFGLNLNPRARIYVPPVVHAFVGSDISAGLLSVDFFRQKAPLLFIDLGTNGEMALYADGKAMVTSTAAGPAFEGMGISHGMRAAVGAIETVWVDGKFLNLRTIGDVPASGICGSGLMDIMAGLIRHRAVAPDGRLKAPREGDADGPFSKRYERVAGTAAIRLADRVTFSQKDIRQFQLAKSAVQTGFDMLLAATGVEQRRLKKIVIAGAFGYHLRPETLKAIGLVPESYRGDVVFAGNTCRTGCALLLTHAASRDYLEDHMSRVTHLAIAESPDFQRRFIANLSLDG